MSVRLGSIKLNCYGDDLTQVTEADEAAIRNKFNHEVINNPEIIEIPRFVGLDKAAIVIGIIALGALVYLAATLNFEKMPEFSYPAVAVVALSILRLAYRRYCISQAKMHLYIGFAILAVYPRLNIDWNTEKMTQEVMREKGYDNRPVRDEGLRKQRIFHTRPCDLQDIRKGLEFVGSWPDGPTGGHWSGEQFAFAALSLRRLLQINLGVDSYCDIDEGSDLAKRLDQDYRELQKKHSV